MATASTPAPNHPIAGKFDDDPRVSFDKTAGKYQYEDDAGQEWEWAEHAWIPIVGSKRLVYPLPPALYIGHNVFK